MIKKQLAQLAQWLASPAKIIVIPHKNPDGDAIGSSLAWQNILQQMVEHPDLNFGIFFYSTF